MNIKSETRYVREEASYNYLGSPHFQDNSFSGTRRFQRYRESTPNPKYKQIIKDEGNATTPLYAYEQYGSSSPAVAYVTFADDGATIGSTWFGQILTPTPIDDLALIPQGQIDEAVAKATTSTYKAISDYQSLFKGQEFAAEFREVIDLIRHPFAKSAKITDSFLRTFSLEGARIQEARRWGTKAKRVGRNLKRNVPKIPKAAADQWLEYQFAVSPLISDISELFKLAADLALKREHETIRGYGNSLTTSNSVIAGGGSGWSVDFDVIEETQVQNIIRAGMTGQFLDSIEKINSNNVWLDQIDDFTSLPLTAWEITPFSFLVDYFVNVQGLIQSATVTQSGLSYVSNSLIKRKERKMICRNNVTLNHPYCQGVTFSQTKQIVSGVRSVNRTSTLLGIPPVVFSFPGSNIRYANIAAILTKLL